MDWSVFSYRAKAGRGSNDTAVAPNVLLGADPRAVLVHQNIGNQVISAVLLRARYPMSGTGLPHPAVLRDAQN
eukprot:3587789-Rhodomonas_salina.2